MFNALQNPLALVGRLLLALLFLPAGIGKITGFAGTVGYIGSVGLPLPALGAVIAIVVEIVGGVALIAGFGTRIAALILALFTLGGFVLLSRLLGCAGRPAIRYPVAVHEEHRGGWWSADAFGLGCRRLEYGRSPQRLNHVVSQRIRIGLK